MDCAEHKITLDIHQTASQMVLSVKKRDTGRRLLIRLSEKGCPYHISDDCFAVFTAKKPDGKILYNKCTIQADTIVYDFTEQTVAVAGQEDCEIKLYGAGGKLITSPSFRLAVDSTVYDDGDEVESSDEFSALTAAIEKVLGGGGKVDELSNQIAYLTDNISNISVFARFVTSKGYVLSIDTNAMTVRIPDGYVFYKRPRPGQSRLPVADTTCAINTESALSFVVMDVVTKAVSSIKPDNFDATAQVVLAVLWKGHYTDPAANWIMGPYQVNGFLYNAPDSGGNVAYDEEQELTEEQKAQARANIGAQPVGEYLTEVPEGYAKNEDIKKVDRKVDTLREVVSIQETAKGEVITVSDASDMELSGLRIFGKTTQDGTPTPESPVELVSVGDGESVKVTVYSKNLFALAEPGSVNASGQEITGANDSARRTPYIKCEPGEKYAFSKAIEFTATNENGVLRCFDADKNITKSIPALEYNVKSNIVTIPSGTAYFRFVQFGYGRYENVDLQIEKGDTVTEYEDVSGNSLTISTPNGLPGIPVSSGGNYTDENGQAWICDEIDFGRGVYVQRVGQATVTDANRWEKSTVTYVDRYLTMLDKSGATQYPNNGFCNVCKIEEISHQVGLGFFDVYQNWTRIAVNFAEYGTTTAADFKAAIPAGGIKCAWVLAEPIETALSVEELAQYAALHSNYPNTTVFNDRNAGMEVKYVADTKLYIDKKFAELSAALLNQ